MLCRVSSPLLTLGDLSSPMMLWEGKDQHEVLLILHVVISSFIVLIDGLGEIGELSSMLFGQGLRLH